MTDTPALRRSFRLVCGPEQIPSVEALLSAQGFVFEPEPFSPLARRLLREPFPLGRSLAAFWGYVYIQDRSSMLPPLALAPGEGARVLDMCASPGSKTGLLAQLVGRGGLVLGNEPARPRLANLRRNLAALNLLQAVTCSWPGESLPLPDASWDAILLDPPCSGWGTTDKNPQAIRRWQGDRLKPMLDLQRKLLTEAGRLLRPGGKLVYSTCTFSPEENEGVISAFLHAHPAFSVEPVEAPWFSPARPDWISDPAPGLEHAFRLWPHCLRGEGHFAAVLRSHADGARQDVPTERPAQLPAAAADFLRSCTQPLPDGVPVCFGSVCYLAPAETPALSGLRVLRAGLELGELRRDRFSPAHALALWLHTYPQTADFPADGPEIAAYLRGETLHGTQRSWTLLTAGGLSLGWVRGADGILKNQYPKGLRRLR